MKSDMNILIKSSTRTSDKVYDILVPEDSENVEVYLENGNSDITLETNPKTAEAVFGLFKTKNADRFDFS